MSERVAASVGPYDHRVAPEDEIVRPRCYPLPARWIIEFKLRSALNLLDVDPAGLKTLVLCCGSGMDAEFLAHQGMLVVGLDISHEALLRAKERARLYNVPYELVVGDAQNLPFRTGGFHIAFVHDGLHHLADAYRGVREMMRVASWAVAIAEPAEARTTRLAIRLGLSGEYEDTGDYVYRLDRKKLSEVFDAAGADHWVFRRDLIYYQPWILSLYRLFEPRPLFLLFKMVFYSVNVVLGRWANSLKAVAWKEEVPINPLRTQ